MGDDVFYEYYAMKAKADERDKRIKELEVICQEKEGFITKLNEECTELNQRNMTLGRVAEAKLDYWRKSYEGNAREVTKLKERVGMVVKNHDAMQKASRQWYEKYKVAEEWRIFWKKGYFDVYAELQDQSKALSEANERLNELGETGEPEAPSWRGRYWEIVGKLAARRDECKYLVEQNEGLKAKVKRFWKEGVIAQGGYDCLHDDLDYFRDECKKSDTMCRDLKAANESLSGGRGLVGTSDKDVEALEKKLQDLEAYHQRYYVKAERRLEAAKLDQHNCHKMIAELREQLNGILEKNIEILKTERTIENLVKECQEARGSLGIKTDRVVFLEELVGSLYGEGWSDLSISGAQDHRSGNKYKLGMLRSRVKQLEAQALRRKLKASQ